MKSPVKIPFECKDWHDKAEERITVVEVDDPISCLSYKYQYALCRTDFWGQDQAEAMRGGACVIVSVRDIEGLN